ncbi:NAD(P)-dependent alcohol dehydrogenase [Paraburkholderia sp. SARCC-3016]|uniref:NAD(P)-dependent alcohol dehydrogenase n=1 Tax=Paraburkholderia sp. SARCC-3016 TaxID=3058611 RepID=UPI002809143E|nr:NAD(P)-dependent alcohol dehydrogenase [Paraburkholderia sp. SARCC-3016]MDQ7977714.1 NAD(P)-dependent alcohol dehydrogenase [Paraburkholderia sp. SARCC-3016]
MGRAARGYAATSSTTPLSLFDFERRTPRNNDVVIEVLYCGVCHSDLHSTRNNWGNARYPMVPGHEIVGRIKEVGSDVTRFKVGDPVGVGCMVDSCQHCKTCLNGLEQYCENGATSTYNNTDRHDQSRTQGGYADEIIVSEKFVLRMPDNLDLKGAAPLLCAGITSYSPLRHWNVGVGSRVAVIGLGGLGHMAIKLASAMGAEVTLITRSPGKDADARALGARDVVLSSNAEQMNAAKSRFDLIIDTIPYQHDLNPYVATLDSGGTLVLVGYFGPLEPALNSSPMLSKRKSVAGSFIGGIAQTQEMLDFCGKHGITCEIEMIDIEQVNEAFDRMLRSDVKYRFVIDLGSLKSGI